MVDDIDIGFFEEEPEPLNDPSVVTATAAIRNFFSRRKMPFYIGQLECKFEKQFFHWITYKAIQELLAEHFLSSRDTIITGNTVKFIYRTGTSSNTIESHINSSSQLLTTVWNEEISKVRGKHLEALVKAELRANAFSIVGTHTNEYKDKVWTETEHDLDFVAELGNGKAIGVEIKNTLPYIPRNEFEIKLRMCKFLGIKPVFAVRWLPKSYIYRVYRRGGFGWLFEYQLYPLGYERLCQTLQQRLGFPTMVMSELPVIPQRLFSSWVQKLNENTNSP